MSIELDLLPIQTQRLRLEPLRVSDAKSMFQILSDKALYKFTGDQPPESRLWLENRYEKLESRTSADGSELWFNWVVLANGAEPVGYVQATIGNDHTELAWLVGIKWQGKGYATEAAVGLVKWLVGVGVNRIRACIHPNHLASQRVAAHAGLVITAEIEEGENVWQL